MDERVLTLGAAFIIYKIYRTLADHRESIDYLLFRIDSLEKANRLLQKYLPETTAGDDIITEDVNSRSSRNV